MLILADDASGIFPETEKMLVRPGVLKAQYSDKKLVQETEEKLLKYLADENPDLAAMVTKLETNWWYQEGENLYLHYWEEPENLDRDAVDFVVRVAPEWRIEFFSCVGNG